MRARFFFETQCSFIHQLKNTWHHRQRPSHSHRACQQRYIILIQSSVCHASPRKPWHTGHIATVVAKVTYGVSSRSGVCSAADRSKLNSFINQCKKFGFCDKELPSVIELFTEADDKLFSTTLRNIHHVLQTFFTRSNCNCLQSV